MSTDALAQVKEALTLPALEALGEELARLRQNESDRHRFVSGEGEFTEMLEHYRGYKAEKAARTAAEARLANAEAALRRARDWRSANMPDDVLAQIDAALSPATPTGPQSVTPEPGSHAGYRPRLADASAAMDHFRAHLPSAMHSAIDRAIDSAVNYVAATYPHSRPATPAPDGEA